MDCQSAVKDKAKKHLRDAPHAISGKGGSNLTFRLAIDLVHGFMLNQGDALELLSEWNKRCDPPWSKAELIHKVEDAGKAEKRNPQGWLCSVGVKKQYSLAPPLKFKDDSVIMVRSCSFPEYCPDGFSIKAYLAGELIPNEGATYEKWLKEFYMPTMQGDTEYQMPDDDPF